MECVNYGRSVMGKMGNKIKYWNHQQGDKKVKESWDNPDEFFEWLDSFAGRINGKFSIKGEGFSCVIDYNGSTESLKSYVLTVIKCGNQDVENE